MEEKVVVITGASSGIGLALARLAGNNGYKVAISARRKKLIEQIAIEIGKNALPIVTDVTRRKDMEYLRDMTVKEYGHIDIWVNNAGRATVKSILELTDKDFDEIINVNLRSFFYGIQTIIPYFQQRGKGHLINNSSFLGRVPYLPFTSLYSAAKSAVNTLTTHIRNDLREKYPYVYVSLVMLGRVRTEAHLHAIGATPLEQPEPSNAWDNSQSAEEAAQTIMTLIEHPVPEIYGSRTLAEMARLYYQDIDTFEKMR
jgi:NADP-dependent 3-hydroxy acid dehydrogenase YdfG